MRNKYLVTGATGFVGRALVSRLHKKRKLICLVRDETKAKSLCDFPIEVARGNMLNKKSLERAVKKSNQVVHIAGVTANHIRTKRGKYKDNITGMENMIIACQKNKIERFIFVSTNAVNYAQNSEYARSKLAAEKLLRQSSLQFTILRPTLIYGIDSRDINQLLRLIKKLPLIPIIGKGNNRCQPIYVGDVVLAIEACLENPATIRETYTIGGRDPITVVELITALQNYLGVKKRIIRLPYHLCSLTALLCESLLPNLGLTRERIETFIADIPVDNARAQERLNWKPKSFKQGFTNLLK